MKDRIILKKAEILKALGQVTRLKILALLAKGERCVCDIYPFVDQEQANVSKHLNMMKRVGILNSRQEGLRVIYYIKSQQVLNILEQAESMVHDEIEEFKKAIIGNSQEKDRVNYSGCLTVTPR